MFNKNSMLNVLIAFLIIYFAQPVILPMAAAFVLYLLVSPLASIAERIRIPLFISSFVLTVAVLSICVFLAVNLVQPAVEWLEKAPQNISQLEGKLSHLKKPFETLERASKQVEDLTSTGAPSARVIEAESPSELKYYFLKFTSNAVASIGLTFFFLFFLIVYGDDFFGSLGAFLLKRSKITDGSILKDIKHSISEYLFLITTINTCLGASIGTALYFIGLPNPFLWGGIAALLNFIPYVGALIGSFLVLIAGAVHFTGWTHILSGPLVYFLLSAFEGQLITPLFLGSKFNLNPLIVLFTMVVLGWAFGVLGAILAAPFLMIISVLVRKIRSLNDWEALLRLPGHP